MATALKSNAINLVNKGSKSSFYNEQQNKLNPVFQAFEQELDLFKKKISKTRQDKKSKPESKSRKLVIIV